MDKKHENPRHVYDAPAHILRRKRTTHVYDGCGRYDERYNKHEDPKDTLTTDTNKRYERKVQHKFYVVTADANDAMKVGQEARRPKTR